MVFLPGQPPQHALPPARMTWVQFLPATPVVLWAGGPFFVRGWASVVNRHLKTARSGDGGTWWRACARTCGLIHGKADPSRGIGAGLSSIDAGVRFRYEFRREFAPYLGVSWHRRFFGTADDDRAAGRAVSSARLALCLRLWL